MYGCVLSLSSRSEYAEGSGNDRSLRYVTFRRKTSDGIGLCRFCRGVSSLNSRGNKEEVVVVEGPWVVVVVSDGGNREEGLETDERRRQEKR